MGERNVARNCSGCDWQTADSKRKGQNTETTPAVKKASAGTSYSYLKEISLQRATRKTPQCQSVVPEWNLSRLIIFATGCKLLQQIWRRGGDLNPRYPLRYVRFRGGSFQPLPHPSAPYNYLGPSRKQRPQ